jgi:hypothetical protein
MPLDNLEPSDNFVQVETKLDAAIDKINEIDNNLTGGTEGQVLKKVDGTDYNYEWSENISNGVIDTQTGEIIRKYQYEIGVWNMDANGNPASAVFFTDLDYKRIKNISVTIVNDANTLIAPIDLPDPTTGVASGRWILNKGGLNGPFLTILRIAGGLFDNTDYNDTNINRGWINFDYYEEA